jgi:glycosyltransferase domain-containing protein
MKYLLLDKLTILILSYNRHKYLKRTINYWSNYNIKLVILDGSDKKLEDKYIKSKNIKYIHNKKGLYDRLLSSAHLIDTEYMILGGDDEFYLPSALCSCVKFLLKDKTYYSCGGLAIGFRTMGKNLVGLAQYPKLKNLHLYHDSAIYRIHNHFSNYVPAHIYSVMRSVKWNIICSNIFKKKYNFKSSEELQFEFLVMVSGKSKIIPKLMWLRNLEVPPADGEAAISKQIRINKWWLEKKFQNEKLDFLKTMLKACNELASNQETKFNEDIISKIFKNYIDREKEKSPVDDLFRVINKLIPIKIKNFIKFFLGIYKRSLINEAISLEAQDIYVNYKELDFAISILEEYQNND